MPVTTYDLPKALYILGGAPIGKQNIALGTTGARTIFQFPTQNFGIGKCAVFFCTFDNFSSTATTATANMGQSTVATQNDWVSGTSINPANTPITLGIPSTMISYAPGTLFQINITGAGAGTCDVTCYGTYY